MSLDSRAENVLKNLVETYIQNGQPVGSRKLSKLPSLGVSSATVRNVMSDLEELGLISAPHTSAGRIPTSLGYRLFVDSMLKATPLSKKSIAEMANTFSKEADPEALLAHASEVLSELTQFAGMVVLPNHSVTRFRQLEFMQLSEGRVLAILVTEDGRVQNRVLSVDAEFCESSLVEAANFFNHRYRGNTLDEVRRLVVADMQRDNDEMHKVNQAAIQAAARVIREEDDKHRSDVVFSGEQKLLDVPDLCQIETLQKLFDVFKTKRDLLSLLDRSMKAEGVSVFIGEESGYSALGECSVIASPYEVDGKVIGTLGVIGPTRMAYDEVISVVDLTARLLSNALTSGHSSRQPKIWFLGAGSCDFWLFHFQVVNALRMHQQGDKTMDNTIIFWPVLAQIAIPFAVLAVNGRRKALDRRSGANDPQQSAIDNTAWSIPVVLTSNNLANQFQFPVVFYALCLILYALDSVSSLAMMVACSFVGLRYFHAYVHVTSNHIPSRFGSFVISVLLLLGLFIITSVALFNAS